MTITRYLFIRLMCIGVTCLAGTDQPSAASASVNEPHASNLTTGTPGDMEMRADARYEEMLDKMEAAVEEIAQLYGNPTFVQIFTNDGERATELKERLKTDRRAADIRLEIEELEKRRGDLIDDISLKKKEARMLGEKLARQRAALDALAAAVEQARRAVEDTVK
jgi:hypothetical protein